MTETQEAQLKKEFQDYFHATFTANDPDKQAHAQMLESHWIDTLGLYADWLIKKMNEHHRSELTTLAEKVREMKKNFIGEYEWASNYDEDLDDVLSLITSLIETK